MLALEIAIEAADLLPLHDREDGIQGVDPQPYHKFLMDNPDFYLITKQRVLSYWDCYYKSQRREDYPGFQIVEYFERVMTASTE